MPVICRAPVIANNGIAHGFFANFNKLKPINQPRLKNILEMNIFFLPFQNLGGNVGFGFADYIDGIQFVLGAQ